MLNKVLGALAANLGSGSTDGGLSCIAVCSLHGCYVNNIEEVSRAALVWCCAFGPPLGYEMEGDRPPPLRPYPSVLGMGKMVAVEYEGKAGLFHHRLILRTASTAAMLNTTGKMCDSRNSLFWILTPDGDV